MDRISFIPQMRGFMAKMQEDRLPGNAVKLYMCLFDMFNKTCWKKEWVRASNDCLKMAFCTKSTSLLYNNRNMLKELGYIDFRIGYVAHHHYTEYKLIALYGNEEGSLESPTDDLAQAGTAASLGCTTLADKVSPGISALHLPSAGTSNGTCNANPASHLPPAGTSNGTSNGTSDGTCSPSEPLSHKASRLPKKKEEEKEVPHSRSIPSGEGIHTAGGSSQGGDFEQSFQVFGICFGRTPQVEEKLGLIELIRHYGRDMVEAGLLSLADEQAAYSQELCQKHIQRQLYGLSTPVPRRQGQVPGWQNFQLA